MGLFWALGHSFSNRRTEAHEFVVPRSMPMMSAPASRVQKQGQFGGGGGGAETFVWMQGRISMVEQSPRFHFVMSGKRAALS